ncbi:putative signal transducing protein [Nocardia sp. NPDC051570]|uniref:putative signal transducing protein n=1 Tax=Nocardia sp. NPDC051570 TaxID=3364324 RepID=UPI0037A1B527
MAELLRTNDAVLLSFAQALLQDAGIRAVLLDEHMSSTEGSLGFLPRRIMVADNQLQQARALLTDAGVADAWKESSPGPVADAEPRALAVFAHLAAGRHEEAWADFGTALSGSVSAEGIAGLWAQLVGELGDYTGSGAAAVRHWNRTTVVAVPLSFAGGERTGLVVFDAAGLVANLFINDSATAAALLTRHPRTWRRTLLWRKAFAFGRRRREKGARVGRL